MSELEMVRSVWATKERYRQERDEARQRERKLLEAIRFLKADNIMPGVQRWCDRTLAEAAIREAEQESASEVPIA